MLWGARSFALRMVLFFSLLAHASPSYAWGLSLNAKAQGLAHYIMAVCHDLNGESAQAISEYQKSVKFTWNVLGVNEKQSLWFICRPV